MPPRRRASAAAPQLASWIAEWRHGPDGSDLPAALAGDLNAAASDRDVFAPLEAAGLGARCAARGSADVSGVPWRASGAAIDHVMVSAELNGDSDGRGGRGGVGQSPVVRPRRHTRRDRPSVAGTVRAMSTAHTPSTRFPRPRFTRATARGTVVGRGGGPQHRGDRGAVRVGVHAARGCRGLPRAGAVGTRSPTWSISALSSRHAPKRSITWPPRPSTDRPLRWWGPHS